MKLNPTECQHKCQLDPSANYCINCERTIEQISNWGNYSKEKKESILNRRVFTTIRTINNLK